MRSIDYDVLSDSEKLDLLRLLYHDLQGRKHLWTARDIEQKELIVAEAQRVYGRIKHTEN